MTIREKIKNGILVLDGGMGTVLQNLGLAPGEGTELWNLSHPDIIRSVHKSYYEAGSDVVYANTFGINRLKYDGKMGRPSVEELVTAAMTHAKAAREEILPSADRELYIAIDIGPTGKLLKPLGNLDFEEAVSVFSEVISLGAKLGADLVTIETMNDTLETKAAVLAAKESCDLPIFVTNSYDAKGKLMTGADPETMVAILEGLQVDAIGLNCSMGPAEMLPIVKRLYAASSLPLIIKPNAGLPEIVDGKTVYNVDAVSFSESLKTAVSCGARIVGGCCGTHPEYIRRLAEQVKCLEPLPVEQRRHTVVTSFNHALVFGDRPILIGERINPTGKKKMKEALKSDSMDYILDEAIDQQDLGADALDVNVGLPGIDEAAWMRRAVTGIQEICNLPLQLDSGDPKVLESAMRLYNGKPLINSVNGKAESMAGIFPLIQKYGGVVIGLTIDEDGIPDNAQKRVEIAEKIIRTAAEYGIGPHEIIIDPLAMTVSSDPNAANVTLDTIRRLHAKGIKTSLGVSNISFGLPNRDLINSAFFALAMQSGLSAAIMNPHSVQMMNTFYSYLALTGKDPNFSSYIEHSVATSSVSAPSASGVAGQTVISENPLHHAIVKGMTQQAKAFAAKALKTVPPLDLISNEIIPALDDVGKGFEAKTIFLPQLLMAADAAKAAFEEVRAVMPKSKGKYAVILATVKGDIHDIGKNIVKVLLENYGFDVLDLGKDVPPETVVETAVREKIRLVGLSALMTTTLPAMKETIRQLREALPECKIVVGGAVLTKEYAEEIGADCYAKDAMETVRYAESLV
ncbi:MAG: homocysteine S-methyltransferase family protein [Eubacteriales bacterium]